MSSDLHSEVGSQAPGSLFGGGSQLPSEVQEQLSSLCCNREEQRGVPILFTWKTFMEHTYLPSAVLGVGGTEV